MDVRSLGIVDDDTMLRCATRCYDELQCYKEHAELQCYDVLDDAKMSYNATMLPSAALFLLPPH